MTRKINDADHDELMAFDHNSFQTYLQNKNRNPLNSVMASRQTYATTASTKKPAHQSKVIDILSKGDIFGEIAVLSNLRRTCSVETIDSCLFQTLRREDIDLIKYKFPSIFTNMRTVAQDYDDEDMTKRRQFVSNIPFLRGLDRDTINQVVFLLKEQTYEKGDRILKQNMGNSNIFIIWEGEVQARVSCYNKEADNYDDLWLDTLEIGACFNIYNCFFKDNLPLLDMYADTKVAKLFCLNANELIELSEKSMSLMDRINTVKLKITGRLVDDIDYFPFPKKYLESNVQFKTDQDIRQERKNYLQQKEVMKHQMIVFVEKYK